VRAHVHALASGQACGAELIDEDERADHGARPGRKRTADLEVAEIVRHGSDGFENAHAQILRMFPMFAVVMELSEQRIERSESVGINEGWQSAAL
jgi:hypothetical protein